MGGIFPLARSDKVLIACGLLVGVAIAVALAGVGFFARTPDAPEAKRADSEDSQSAECAAVIRERVAKYASATKSARDALNALKKVQARAEIGVNHSQYSEVLGQAWADITIFLDSPEGKELWEFSRVLSKGVACYKKALADWNEKFEVNEPNLGIALDMSIQWEWRDASYEIELGKKLLDPNSCESALKSVNVDGEVEGR
jgi:hypothetical protein